MKSSSVVQKGFNLHISSQKKIRQVLKIHEAWSPRPWGTSQKGFQVILTFLAMSVSADVISAIYTCGTHNQQLLEIRLKMTT